MKKLALASAAALGFVSAANAHAVDTVNKSGFYLGVNGGYTFTKSKYKDVNGDKTIKPKGLIGGFHAGYQHDLGRMVVGVEGSVGFTKAHKKLSKTLGNDKYDYNIKRKNIYGAALRVGYKVAPCWVAGVKLGYERNNYQIKQIVSNKNTGIVGFNDNKKIKHNGFVPGIYVEKLLNRHWMVGAEYSYAMYKKKSFTDSAKDKITHTPRAHDIKVRLGYKF